MLPLRLVFIPERHYWCVVRGGDWYRVTNEFDLVDLLSVLRAEIVTSKQLGEFPAIAGDAVVEQIDQNDCVVMFADAAGQVLAREAVRIDEAALADLTWTSGKYRDGWTALTAEFEAEASGRLEFDLFLPESELLGDKVLTATIGDEVVFRCEVARGVGFRTPGIDLGGFDGSVRICLSTDYAERGSGDQRDLGVLVIGVLLNGVSVMPGSVEF